MIDCPIINIIQADNALKIKDYISIIQSIIVSIGVLVGGYWTYWLFIKNRQKYPRANIIHIISHKTLDDGQAFLRVMTEIHNSGNVLISLVSGKTRLQQVLPMSDDMKKHINDYKINDKNEKNEIEWPEICEKEIKWDKGKCEIEPGEKDQMCYDFIIDPDVETISIYSYFQNIEKKTKNMGWGITTIYNIKKGDCDDKRS